MRRQTFKQEYEAILAELKAIDNFANLTPEQNQKFGHFAFLLTSDKTFLNKIEKILENIYPARSTLGPQLGGGVLDRAAAGVGVLVDNEATIEREFSKRIVLLKDPSFIVDVYKGLVAKNIPFRDNIEQDVSKIEQAYDTLTETFLRNIKVGNEETLLDKFQADTTGQYKDFKALVRHTIALHDLQPDGSRFINKRGILLSQLIEKLQATKRAAEQNAVAEERKDDFTKGLENFLKEVAAEEKSVYGPSQQEKLRVKMESTLDTRKEVLDIYTAIKAKTVEEGKQEEEAKRVRENKKRCIADILFYYNPQKGDISNARAIDVDPQIDVNRVTTAIDKALEGVEKDSQDVNTKIVNALNNLENPTYIEKILIHEFTNNPSEAKLLFSEILEKPRAYKAGVETYFEEYSEIARKVGSIKSIIEANKKAKKTEAEEKKQDTPAKEEEVLQYSSRNSIKQREQDLKEKKKQAAKQSKYAAWLTSALVIAGIPTAAAILNSTSAISLTASTGAQIGGAVIAAAILPIIGGILAGAFFAYKKRQDRQEFQKKLEDLYNENPLNPKDPKERQAAANELHTEIEKREKARFTENIATIGTVVLGLVGIAFAAAFAGSMGPIGSTALISGLISVMFSAVVENTARAQELKDLQNLEEALSKPQKEQLFEAKAEKPQPHQTKEQNASAKEGSSKGKAASYREAVAQQEESSRHIS